MNNVTIKNVYCESHYEIKDVDLERLWKDCYGKRIRVKTLIPNWGTSHGLSYYLRHQVKETYILNKKWIDDSFDKDPRIFMIFHILIQDEILPEGNWLITNTSF